MGMDVYGLMPKNDTGKYFRNNVWWWRPLWDYCLYSYPNLAGKVQNGHTNDGDGLNSSDAQKLALFIKKDLENGKVKNYEELRQKHLDSLPEVPCEHCSSTGFRNDAFVVGTCNACNGKGTSKDFALSYPFSIENVQEFQQFLENCGGFQIC